MNTLIFKVNGENIKWVSGYEPTSGEKNYSKLRFEFDDEWKNVDSVTVLQYFDVSKPELVAGIEVKDMVAVAGISKELRNQSGILHIGVYGVKSDNPDVTLSSHIAFVPVGKGVNLVGTEYTTFVQELLEYIARLEGRLIDKDNPVTTELLKDGTVTGEKIALNAIEDKHLLEPYWKIKTLIVRTSNDIDSVFEHDGAEESIYCINFSGLSAFASVAGEDNYIGLVDVTAEKITLLNKKEGVLWRYVKGSGNLEKIYSEIRDGAVDSSKLADGAVTGRQIADYTIGPEKLTKTYREFYTATIRGYSDLDNMIELDNSENVYFDIDVSGLAPFFDIVGEGGVSAEVNGDVLTLLNGKSGKSWFYEKGSEKLVETLSNKMNTADTFFRVNGLGDNVDPEIIAYQTNDPTTPEMLRIPLSLIKGNNDFINAGNFASLSELKDYKFEFEKTYKLEIKSDIVTANNVTIDAGVYICRYYLSPPYMHDAYFLELIPFVPNGKSWALDLEGGNGFLTDLPTDCATVEYVDSKINNVNNQLSGINTQLEGLDELLASI